MLGKAGEWIAQDLRKNGYKYADGLTGISLEEPKVRQARETEIRNFCTKFLPKLKYVM